MEQVSKLPLLTVLQGWHYWVPEDILRDKYDDDLTDDCITNISKILSKKKDILIIGCSGGGYNAYKLCKQILMASDYVPQITVIDKHKSKMDIGILALCLLQFYSLT
jgi:hypothetical protein